MVKIVENITELVGNSPIIKLKNGPENGAEIYLKLEYFNPGGSVKDRIALQMIRQAEADGRLKKGGTIVEPTSGNTGIGLAMAGAALGYMWLLSCLIVTQKSVVSLFKLMEQN